MNSAIDKLKAVLLDPEGNVSIIGSNEDCEIIKQSLFDIEKQLDLFVLGILERNKSVNSHDTLKAKADMLDKMVEMLEAVLNSTVYADAEGLIYIEEGGCDDAEHREIVAQAKTALKAAKEI